MRALLIPIGLSIVVGIAASVACSSSVSISTVPSFGTCSDATGYAVVTADDCPGLSCGTYYATCNGSVYDGCDCDIPSGYTVIADPDFGDAGTGAGGDGGTGSETGTGGDDGGTGAETGAGDGGTGAETGTGGDDGGTGAETGSGGGDDSGSAAG
jgi:hypothetical protein